MKKEAFISRLPAGAPGECAETIETVFNLSARYEEKVAVIRANPNLTAFGKAQAIAELRNSGFNQHFTALEQPVKTGLENTRLERSRLGLPPVDRTDSVGELQRRELRDYARTLPLHERLALAQNDPAVRDAVLRAPTQALSGLPPEAHASLFEQAIESLHGPRLAELKVLEGSYEITSDAMRLANDDMDRSSRITGVVAA